MKKEYYILGLITIIGGYLRFDGLTANPFWYDEAFFGVTLRDNIWGQEYVTHFIAWLFRLDTDFGLRFVSALFGTLSIPAIYFVLKNNKWLGVAFVAFNPLFIFWSQMARPYATAGFLCILAWRWWWLYIPAIATTFISIIAFRGKKKIFFLMLGLMIFFFIIRPDAATGNWFQYIGITFLSGRLWYLPMIALILYLCDYIIPFSIKMEASKPIGYVLLGAMFMFFLYPSDWYRKDVIMFSDWRDCGKMDYATEWNNASWYGNCDAKYFSHWQNKRIDSLLNAGDTLKVGLGQLALGACRKYTESKIGRIPNQFLTDISNGGIVRIQLWKTGYKQY